MLMPTGPRSFQTPEPPDDASVTGFARAAGLPVPRIWRSRSDRVVAGVLGGLSEKFGWEPLPVRLLYGFLTIASAGLLAIPYVGIWAITRAHGPERRGPWLWRSRSNKIVAGVLGGLAEKFGVPATLARLAYAALTVFSMGVPGVLIYLVLWAATSPMDAPDGQDM
jgi:phage shock protein PspC (stress-responsive transcriptional regulator)